jgi:hypothetical protein
MKKPRFAIGIDPGKQTGLAIYDRKDGKLVEVRTDDFWGVYGYVTLHDTDRVEVVIENPALIKRPMYSRLNKVQGASVRENMASKIGENRREAELLIEGLRQRGFTVKEVKPTQTKMDADEFKRLTKYQGKTNQHVRDAAMLVYGL